MLRSLVGSEMCIRDRSTNNAKTRAHSEDDVSSSPEAVGFFTQYFATLRRQLLQKSRMPCSWATEIILPILFVVGIILISLAVTPEDKPATQFVSNDNSIASIGDEIRSSMCYANATTTDAGLQALLSACPFNRSSIPATAKCMPENVFTYVNATAQDICVTSFDVATFISKSVSGFKQQVGLLDFDDMVLLQLMSRVVYGGPTVSLFATDSVIASLRTSGQLYLTPQSTLCLLYTSYASDEET
eukprot:TRINITY_DN60193_c0_g1_i1.p1 TRINITY_DN60193_c0_g1~~TRINITY_DN60193_c0_g1_i1.p1  ORF type:complete len:244 (-),score=80.44 TRINITY_DN60193_c0_g1_i1:18-749(-)